MKRLVLLIGALIACVALLVPAGALADGDPGSDELVYQHLFIGPDDNIPAAEQVQLGKLLNATIALKAPVRVAIIGKRDDLGSITPYFGEAATYAHYLGTELELAYSGRLLVVMPQGVASFWFKHDKGTSLTVPSGASPGQLVHAAAAGVAKLEAAAGITGAALTQAARSAGVTSAAISQAHASPTAAIASTAASRSRAKPSATSVSPVIVVVGLLVILGAVFWAPALWRRRGLLQRGGIALPGMAVGLTALGALVVLAVVIHSNNASTASDTALATNPNLSGVSSLGNSKLAPNFTLTDETGRRVSLKQFRGKVVLLSFTDDECQTICPLTTQAMVDARDALGPAAKDVQLLGVNANAKSTTVYDVQSYTALHGLLGQWHFLTGSQAQLRPVWKKYFVEDDIGSNIIDHTPALYIIGPDGKMRASSITRSNYASIPQYGQELAEAISRILPAHPKVQTHLSYATVRGISPSTRTVLPTVGGGQVTLGAGKPHLYLFFATWDQQSTAIKGQMELLNAYAREAKARGLPPLTAIDEEAVEPNPTAVTKFLAGMHLDYPVAIDRTGQIADGYGVQGEPWFVLAAPEAKDTVAQPDAQIPFFQEVYTQGWPSLKTLVDYMQAALKPAPKISVTRAVARDLAGSPPALASLHTESSTIVAGGPSGLLKRIRALRGHPIVINIWGSWCPPCQQEFPYFSAASAIYGKKVAFLGADYEEPSAQAGQQFLSHHRVSYPSYEIGDGEFPTQLLRGGVTATPTTIFISPQGKVSYIRSQGEYTSQGSLDQDIEAYALQTSS
jgi:cytochrome oxidase Cu insertion factor (SCO1/SenC/PrrC family)/thiol-disulfide isomerase/thioredoxin